MSYVSFMSETNTCVKAHSSRGSGRCPLKAEITGSNPVCATNLLLAAIFIAKTGLAACPFLVFATNLLLITFSRFVFTLVVKYVIKPLGGGFLKAWHNMAVDVQGHFNAGMA